MLISHPEGQVRLAAAVRQWEWLMAAGVLAIVSAISFSPVMAVLMEQWSANDTYSFGVLVPFISGYFIWLRRDRILQLEVAPSPLIGTLLVGTCATLLAFGRAIGVIGIQEIGMVLMVPSMIWLLCGRRVVRALWFPLLYLFLMLPIWEILTDRFHYQSQLFSATLAETLLTFAGIPVHRSATYLELPNITLEVASVCSGVNFLLAVIAVGVPQAYLFLRGLMPRAIVIGFALAIALFSNGLRIAIIGILSHYQLTKNVHGPGHLLQGLFVSSAGLIALQAAVGFMARRYPRPQRPVARAAPAVTAAVPPQQLTLAVAAATFVIVLAGDFQPSALVASSVSKGDEAVAVSSLPMQFVQGGPKPNLGRIFETTSGGKVEVYTGELAYADPGGGLGYRRVTVPTQSAISEMPVQTPQGMIYVNSVSFRRNGRDIDVVSWYDIDGTVTSQVTTAKLSTLWRLLSGQRPLPLLIVVSRTRVASPGDMREPIGQIVADVFAALRTGS